VSTLLIVGRLMISNTLPKAVSKDEVVAGTGGRPEIGDVFGKTAEFLMTLIIRALKDEVAKIEDV
jgi:hypothetical protein